MAIEPFTLHDNLMLAGGAITSRGCLVAEAMPHAGCYTSRWCADMRGWRGTTNEV